MNFNWRKIFIIGVIVICIVLIILALYLKLVEKDNTINKKQEIIVDSEFLRENFNNLFDNSIDYQNNSSSSAMKIDFSKELIYTNHSKQAQKEGKYEIDINIPYINIKTNVITNINKEIEEIFYNKLNSVIKNTSDIEMIYNVKYKAFINDNILSLIIISDLKEATDSERLIIKTYNYNISSNEILHLDSLLNYRSLDLDVVQNKIISSIKEAQKKSITQGIGNNIYLRNVNDDMYKLKNTNVFFLGEGKALYILYPYGNSNYTTELDLIIM